MINKITFKIVVNELNRQYCNELDAKLEKSLRSALEDKRISKERQNKIVNDFCDCMEVVD
jgi:hypothetical protein